MDQQLSPPRVLMPDPDAPSFEVDGVVYTRNPELSVARAKKLQRYQLELALNISLAGFIETLNKAWNGFEGGKMGTGIYEVGRLRDGINAVVEDRMSNVNIVALFYNAPDEDPTTYDHEAMKRKMQKWEGVAAGFFTVAAFTLLTATSPHYPLPDLDQPNLSTPTTDEP